LYWELEGKNRQLLISMASSLDLDSKSRL
jgi:hypothetical protein